MKKMQFICLSTLFLFLLSISAQVVNDKYKQADKFRQLDENLRTPNAYRTASGAPGHKYWQQRADYVINVEIDDENQRLIGSEKIAYTNHSPDTLNYFFFIIYL